MQSKRVRAAHVSEVSVIQNPKFLIRIAKLVRDAGGKNLEGPEICVDYSPGYYAFFFEDPNGNKLEICCRESPIIA